MANIRTDPPNAKVSINGQLVGKTPIDTSLSNFDFTVYNVTIAKEGYETFAASLQKQFKVGAFVFGLFFWWPEFLFVYGPKPYQAYELEPVK